MYVYTCVYSLEVVVINRTDQKVVEKKQC